jgi:membrane-bound inhibitor of C-type lysozyme
VAAGYSWCEARSECERPWERYCTATPPRTVLFSCDAGKSIAATFYIGDDRFVDLVLSDGRAMSIPRAISASGARYATADESLVFWNKGETAFITEGAITSFDGCKISTD